MRRELRASPDMDSTSQDHGVSPQGARPSLLSSPTTPSPAPGVRLLDAISPTAHAAPAVPSRPRVPAKWLWGLTGVVVLGGTAFWASSSGHLGGAPGSSGSFAPALAQTPPEPAPLASVPPSADGQTVAAAPAASDPPAVATPAQIVAMAAPQPRAPVPGSDTPADTATAAHALAADSLAERSSPSPARISPPSQPTAKTAAKGTSARKPAKTAGSKRSAESGSGLAKAKPKAARQRNEPDPDADVVAAIMAGMDRQAAAAAKSAQAAQAASQSGARRP